MNIPIQPTGLNVYLGAARIVVPPRLRRLFYMSWEDALWDIMAAKNIKEKSIILVPEFFCGDVVIAMKKHGLRTIWYPCDKNFQTDPLIFKKIIEKHDPTFIVIFHAAGITNNLFVTYKKWLSAMSSKTIIIEDAVHRIVDPRKIKIIHPHHVIIDSLRKVTPLQGSNLYGRVDFLNFKQGKSLNTLLYGSTVVLLSCIFQFFLFLTILFKWQRIGKLFNLLAEKIMVRIYRLTGSSNKSSPGMGVFNYLSQRLDIRRIEHSKKKQVAKYHKDLSSIFKTPHFFKIAIPPKDEKLLRGFPVGIHLPQATAIRTFLRKQGFLALFELNDCPWSKHEKVIYLPLGPHISNGDIEFVITQLNKSALL